MSKVTIDIPCPWYERSHGHESELDLDPNGIIISHHELQVAKIPGSPDTIIESSVRIWSEKRSASARGPVLECQPRPIDILDEIRNLTAGQARTFAAALVRAADLPEQMCSDAPGQSPVNAGPLADCW